MKNADKPAASYVYTSTEEKYGGAGTFIKTNIEPGLTKRELIAAMAMQGILHNLAIADETLAVIQRKYYEKQYPGASEFECVARESVSMADELLRQLDTPEK